MMSDVCKHCVHAGCLEVCPTGAIIRTEFDTVVIQADVCNGCRDCIAACPFGVIDDQPGVAAPRRSARSATTGCRAGWSPPAPRPARPQSIQFGTDRRAAREGADSASSSSTQAGRDARLPLRRRRQDPRRTELVLPAGRPAGGLRSAARSEDADAASSGPRRWCSVLGAIMVGVLGMISFRNRTVSRVDGSRASIPEQRP